MSKCREVAISSVSSVVMLSNTLFQKIRTHPWAQCCASHLPANGNFMRHFLSNWGNPAKPRARMNATLYTMSKFCDVQKKKIIIT